MRTIGVSDGSYSSLTPARSPIRLRVFSGEFGVRCADCWEGTSSLAPVCQKKVFRLYVSGASSRTVETPTTAQGMK